MEVIWARLRVRIGVGDDRLHLSRGTRNVVVSTTEIVLVLIAESLKYEFSFTSRFTSTVPGMANSLIGYMSCQLTSYIFERFISGVLPNPPSHKALRLIN
jgi:hypothetical protein